MVSTIWLHLYRVLLTGSTNSQRMSTGVGVIYWVNAACLSLTGICCVGLQLGSGPSTVGSKLPCYAWWVRRAGERHQPVGDVC